jgi:hypothetical protein
LDKERWEPIMSAGSAGVGQESSFAGAHGADRRARFLTMAVAAK